MKIFLAILLLMGTFLCHAQTRFEIGASTDIAFNKLINPKMIEGDTEKGVMTVSLYFLVGVSINNKVQIISGIGRLTNGEEYSNYEAPYINPYGPSGPSIIEEKYITKNRFISFPLNIAYNFLKKDEQISFGLIFLSNFSILNSQKTTTSAVVSDYYPTPYQSGNDITILHYSNNGLTGYNHYNLSVGGGVFLGYNFSKHFNALVYPFYKRDITVLYNGSQNNVPHYSLNTFTYGIPTRSYYSVGGSLAVFYKF